VEVVVGSDGVQGGGGCGVGSGQAGQLTRDAAAAAFRGESERHISGGASKARSSPPPPPPLCTSKGGAS